MFDDTHSGRGDSDGVQNKIVHFKSAFFFFLSKLYILSYNFVSFHLLDEFLSLKGRRKSCLWEKQVARRTNQQYAQWDHTDVWLSVEVLPLQLDVKHR